TEHSGAVSGIVPLYAGAGIHSHRRRRLKMKNKLVRTILICYLFFLIVVPLFSTITEGTPLADLQLNPFDYARITDVDYTAVVMDEPESGGSVRITERLTFDVHAASRDNLYWELWRDLPEDYI